ncbi:MAG: hypothetical protein AAF327_24935 [Cyanobacteria bacterium P01_A01_bin.37]
MKKTTLNLTFASVLILTIASGGTAVHIASQPTLSEHQDRILDNAQNIFTLGATSLMGLLNSCSDDDESKSDEDETQ